MSKRTPAAEPASAPLPPVPPGGGSWVWDAAAHEYRRDEAVPQTTAGDLAPLPEKDATP